MAPKPIFHLSDESSSDTERPNLYPSVSALSVHSATRTPAEPQAARSRGRTPQHLLPGHERSRSASSMRRIIPTFAAPKTNVSKTTDDYLKMKNTTKKVEQEESSSEDEGPSTSNLPKFYHSNKTKFAKEVEDDADGVIAKDCGPELEEQNYLEQYERKKANLPTEVQSDDNLTDDESSINTKGSREEEEDQDHFRNFLSKTTGWTDRFLAYTGGPTGLAAVTTEAKQPVHDLENQKDRVEESIPMENLAQAAQLLSQANIAGVGTSSSVSPEEIQEMLNYETSSDKETITSSELSGNTLAHAADYDSEFEDSNDFVSAPKKVRGGVLGAMLKLYQNPDQSMSTSSMTTEGSEFTKKHKSISFTDLPNLSKSGNLPKFKSNKKGKSIKSKARRKKQEARITVHIAELLQRHNFVLRLCKTFMLYGAPTHRLEEYMVMTCRVLEIDGQFLYVPGCMIISFGDSVTRTSEVHLVRCDQGLNLYKLSLVHTMYKQVIHDVVGVDEANLTLDRIIADKDLYPDWVCVLLYGFCSAMVTPFAYGGGWVNMPVSFIIGCCVGFLKLYVSTKSNVYSSVFEVTASIVISFIGRALGSIPGSNICFGAVVQGALAMILPGFLILTGTLEMQSRNIIAGSVRMFYAIIYFMFLGFGITLGAALFGWMYHKASSETTCALKISPWYRFIFVPGFTVGLALVNQAHWSQLPIMTVISGLAYVVSYFCSLHFTASTEFNSSIAAFAIGIMGNLYSRIYKGLAITAMLPGIFVQIPSGIAASNTFLTGVQTANQINGNRTDSSKVDVSSSVNLSVTLIQVIIGISVGLFASSIFIYPFGKKKTGLFTF